VRSLQKDLDALEEWFRTGGGSRAERNRCACNLRRTLDPLAPEQVAEITFIEHLRGHHPDGNIEPSDAYYEWASLGGLQAWRDLEGMAETICRDAESFEFSLLEAMGLVGERNRRCRDRFYRLLDEFESGAEESRCWWNQANKNREPGLLDPGS
jgi:hypothetical protein